jgi:DNA-binding NtrC family response regulator
MNLRQPATQEHGRMLVVDDDASQRISLEALLSGELTVVSAANVASARRALAETPFDVVLTDYSLPDGTGMQVLKAMTEASPHTTGMLVTAHYEFPEVLAARGNPRVFRVILKPYDPVMLLGWVKSAATLSRMRGSGARRVF